MTTGRRDDFSWRLFAMAMARRLGIRTRPARTDRELIEDADRWSDTTAEPVETALSRLLGELEGRALAVYEQAGLPTQPGHYARAPGDRAWQFVAETMSPADRWAMIHEYPPEIGWRFATLQGLGLLEPAGDPAVEAANILSECRTLRESGEVRHHPTAMLLERAIRLGWSGADLDRHFNASRTGSLDPAGLLQADPADDGSVPQA